MDETKFLELADAELNRLQDAIESESDDAECTRNGNVLSIVTDDGPEVVVNIQTPMREIWLASLRGGYHFRFEDGVWTERRTGETLQARLRAAMKP